MIPGQSGLGSDGNKGVLPHSWNLTIRLFSVNSRMLFGEWGGVGSYPSAEVQLVYSTAQADWARQQF